MTLTEINNYGFEVQKSMDSTGQFEMIPNGFIPGYGTTLEPHHYTLLDSSVSSGRWWYRLKQIDLDGTFHFTDPVCVNVVTEAKENPVPKLFALQQNYPNPFNPNTRIGFQVTGYGRVNLAVFDVLGREVVTLVNEVKQPGLYTVQWDANGLASGVYFYRLQSGTFVAVRRLTIIR